MPHLKGLQEKLGPYIGKGVIVSRVRAIRKTASMVPRGRALQFTVLPLIFVLALAIRLLPLRWGFYLSEFDPYIQWRMAEYVVKNGFIAWFNWHDMMSWYPWGLIMKFSNLYGLAFTVAAVYMFLNALGVQTTVFQVAVLLPVVGGALTAIACYFLGKDLWGTGAGLLAALFMALNPSNISRTTLGFLRHETLGVLLMVLFFLFFFRANQKTRSLRGTFAYAILAGLTLFYLTAEWAAYYYPMDLIVLYVGVLALTNRYSRKLLCSYVITYGVFLALLPLVPKESGALMDITFLVIPGVTILLLAREIGSKLQSWKLRGYTIGIVTVALIGIACFLIVFKFMTLPVGKFLSTINPFARLDMPIVQSVAEHKTATWASFFYEYDTLLFLGLFGFYFILHRLRDTDIFLVLAVTTSLYFAGSLVRLTLLLAPSFTLLAAITTVEMAKPAIDILRQAVIFPRRKIPGIVKVGREFGLAILLILIIAIVPAFSKAVSAAYAPATIVTSSIPVTPTEGGQKYDDWLQTLAWLHDNTPKDAVIMAWWDYGYWITALADRKTLADNGTQNSTQIALLAQMFMRNETTAIPMMKHYNVSYVTVFATYAQLPNQNKPGWIGIGEDGKWYWMVRIANQTSYNNQTILFQQKTTTVPSETSTTPTTVIEYYRVLKTGDKIIANDTISSGQQLQDNSILGFIMNTGVGISQAKSDYLEHEFTSANGFVFVYKVTYPTTTLITVNVNKNKIPYGENASITGTVMDTDKVSYKTGQVTLQAAVQENPLMPAQWGPFASTNIENGKFNYTWIKPFPGNYSIRAVWSGVKGESLTATSNSTSLLVEPTKITLAISLSNQEITFGQNTTISLRLSENLSNGTLTIRYSTDNKTWTNIGNPLQPKNGTASYPWKPETTGTMYVQGSYSGIGTIGSATSETIELHVKPIVTLTLSLSNNNISLGQNTTISLTLSKPLNGALTIQYSTNNKTWTEITTAQLKNGAFTYVWKPTTAGTMYIQATYSGGPETGTATSNTTTLKVNKT